MNSGKTKNIFIGSNDYYLNIGEVYFATSRMPSRWKRWALRFCFGITFITKKQEEEILNNAEERKINSYGK